MLFKNLVSGNIVSATNETVVEQMKKSPTYEPVVPTPVQEPETTSPKDAEPKEDKPTKSGRSKKAAE